jgi:peptidoglycan/xylan/chitin deacetylase (PgdA/CDA1 family)
MAILCYHTVEPEWASTLSITPEAFELHCEWLSRHRDVVDLDTAIRSLDGRFRPRGRTSALTFDDGWTGVYDHAWPILRRYRLPFTLFVIANSLTDAGISFQWVERPPEQALGVLSLDQVKELHADGVNIASHSLAHDDLRTLGPDDCLKDLVESREILEDLLEDRITTLAYPKGDHDASVRMAAERAGYLAAFALPERREEVGQFSIPRVGVYPGNSPRSLWVKTRRRYLDVRLSRAYPGH